MNSAINFCFLCLNHDINVINISSEDSDGVILEDKLKCVLPEYIILKINITKCICVSCLGNLNSIYKFKQDCIKNISTLNEYAEKLTERDGTYEFLSINDILLYKDTGILQENVEIKREDVIEDIIIKTEDIKDEFDDESQIKTRNTRNVKDKAPKHLKCKYCQKSFNRLDTLIIHERIHTNERPYKCTICDKSFRQSYRLVEHLRIHSGYKPYECNLCSYKCSVKGSLRRHSRTHTEQKAFECENCPKSFSRWSGLKNHKKKFHNDL